jgi:hypothetical protein
MIHQRHRRLSRGNNPVKLLRETKVNMRTHRTEPRESVKLIAKLTYYRKLSGVVARGKVLAVPLLALFLVPFLIEAAQAFQLNRGNYRPAVTQPVNRVPLNGINGSNFSTNRFNYAPNVTRSVNPGVTQMNNKMYGTGNKSMNINASSGINRSNSFSTNRSNYAPTVTRSVNPGPTQMYNKMYGTGNKSMNINALMGNQIFKQNIGLPRNNGNINGLMANRIFKQNVVLPRNNATNLNSNRTRTTGVNVNNSSQKNVNTKIYNGALGKKFQY